MKNYKLLYFIVSIVLCFGLILTTTACKDNKTNASSEDYEVVYEYLEESDFEKSDDNSSSEDEDSEKSESKNESSKHSNSKDKNSKDESSQKDNSKDKDENSKANNSNDETSKEENSKKDSSKDKASENENLKPNSSKDKTSKDEGSKTGSSKDKTSKEESKTENSEPTDSADKDENKNEASEPTGSKDKTNKEESNADASSKNDASNNDSDKTQSSSAEKSVYKSTSELQDADLPVNSIVTLDIEPYAKGKYKIVNGSYLSNDSSIVYISSGKFAVRYVEKLNAWRDSVPKGSFIAHQGFNGWIDKSYIGGGTTSNGTYPSNTKEAVDHAVRLGYKFVEIDITITKDKVWVVNHDANSKEIIADLTREVKNFTSMDSRLITNMKLQRKWKGGGYWEFSDKINKEYVPTLEDVLKYAKDKNFYIILDNKSLSHHQFTDEEYDILADLINKYNMGSRCAAYAECLKPLTNRIHGLIACYSGLPNDDEETAYNIMSSYGNFMLSVSIGQYKEFLPFAKKYNVPLAVWVVDDYETADTMFAEGVDYVLSNYCLPNNANLSDYKNIKTFSFNDFATEKRANEATVSYEGDAVNVTANSEGAAQLTLKYRDLGLKTGDIIVLSADCNIKSGSAFIKVATDNNDAVLEAKRTIKDKNTVYYVVNDDNGVSLTANLGVKNGSATFKNVKIEIMRETARGEK